MQVRHGVVRVVLGLPPLHGEALEQITDDNAHHISVGTVLEHLVMQEVVGQPAALLPEQSH